MFWVGIQVQCHGARRCRQPSVDSTPANGMARGPGTEPVSWMQRKSTHDLYQTSCVLWREFACMHDCAHHPPRVLHL
eukprot:15463682-Alexandrium_andersonii.AAC.1